MKIRHKLALLAVFLLSNWSTPGFTADSDWLIDQESSSLGKTTIYYSPAAVRVDLQRINAIMVMKAPDWRVHFFQPTRRLIYEVDADKFEGQVRSSKIVAIVSCPRLGIKVDYKNDEKFAGLPAKHYTYKPDEIQAERAGIISADYWISKLPLGGKPSVVIEKLYNIPLVGGLPIGFYTRSTNKYDYKELNTRYAATRKFDSKTFEVPKGFKYVKTTFDFWNAAMGVDRGSADLMEMLGPSGESGQHSKSSSIKH